MEPITKIYYESLEKGKIMALKCPDCGNVEWPPVPTCNSCSCMDMKWISINGDATIDMLVPGLKGFARGPFIPFSPYYICKGKLKEGTAFINMVLDVKKPEDAQKAHHKLEEGDTVKAKAMIIQLNNGIKAVAFSLVD